LIVDTTHTMLGVLSQSMLNMVSRTMFHLLLVQANCTMTMHASEAIRCNADDFGCAHVNPFPVITARTTEFFFLFASRHQVMRHSVTPNSERAYVPR
jgi:hypothetical protein